MRDEALLRYSRHIMLPQLDIAGQQRLLQGRALVVGVGGLGSPVAMYLVAAGVGQITLVDDDVVELSNLQRQIVHDSHSLGQTKTASARERLLAMNPDCQVHCHPTRLADAALKEQVAAHQVVLDCSDNFTTRFQLNALCVQTQTPLVSGAAIGFEGQLAVFDARQPESPCYACLYKDMDDEALNCADSGVLASVVGVIGSLQATEALKLLADVGDSPVGRLTLWDALHSDWRQLRLPKDPSCAVCAAQNG